MSEMTARQHALRIAALEALADAVATEYAKARAEAEPVFAAKYADEGNDRQAVLLPSGEKVGQLTIKAPSASVEMTGGQDGLLDWCREHFPAAVEEYIDPAKVGSADVIAAVRDKLPDAIRYRVRPATAKALTEEIVKGKGLLADRRSGEAGAGRHGDARQAHGGVRVHRGEQRRAAAAADGRAAGRGTPGSRRVRPARPARSGGAP